VEMAILSYPGLIRRVSGHWKGMCPWSSWRFHWNYWISNSQLCFDYYFATDSRVHCPSLYLCTIRDWIPALAWTVLHSEGADQISFILPTISGWFPFPLLVISRGWNSEGRSYHVRFRLRCTISIRVWRNNAHLGEAPLYPGNLQLNKSSWTVFHR